MYPEDIRKIWLICVATGVLVLAGAVSSGFCQDGAELTPGGTGFGILPITRALTEMPMHISFNGSSHEDPYLTRWGSDPGPGHGKKGHLAHIRLPLAAPGIKANLTRIRGYLFRYIQVAAPSVVPGESGFDYFDHDTPPTHNGSPKDISLEIQADIKDLGGALFIVMTL